MPLHNNPPLDSSNVTSRAPKFAYALQQAPESPTRRSPPKIWQSDGEEVPDHVAPEKEPVDEASALYTSEEERAVLRRLDRRLVLFIALLYMLGFLDRSNIGNAKVAGLADDLSLNSSQYEWILRSFYITYLLFEWMPVLYAVLSPSTYIASCVAAWGLIASLQALATSYASLCVLRALLGISEAAFSPGVPVFLAYFYKRDELAYRIGLFISAAPLATSFAGSLAWAITKLGQRSPIAPWRMLFLVEGFPSVVISVFAFYSIPNSPGVAQFLTKRQRRVAELRLRREKPRDQQESGRRSFQWEEIWAAVKDPKCYLTALMFCSCNVAFSSLPVFLPTIITDMGYSALQSQALSAPPYLIAFVTVLLTAYYSDKYKDRSLFICFHAILAAGGYALITVAGILKANSLWRYWGVYPAASGFFSAVTLLITWTINNQDSEAKQGTGVAILNLIGQLGPFIGTALYPEGDKPYYVRGMAVCTVFMLVVAALSLWLRMIIYYQNQVTDRRYTVLEDICGNDGSNGEEGKLVGQRKQFTYIL